MKLFLIVAAVGVLTYVLVEIVRVLRLARRSFALAKDSRPYSCGVGAFTILVLGDSTAVGTGAKTPEESIPGRLGSHLRASVENYAQNGATVSDILQQLARAEREHYDLILVQAGGNDIIKLRSLQVSNTNMDALLFDIRKRSGRVALLTAGRLGKAPFFPKLIAPLFTARSLALRSLFTTTAERHGVLYVDLLGMSSRFDADPGRYYAADMLHLTGAGYGLWFEKLERDMRARWPELFTTQGELNSGGPYHTE